MPVSNELPTSVVQIPPSFPLILKQYAKAAIRTQPYDLLKWSATYFRALANGEEPPSKIRIEYDVYDTPSGLTPGYLKLLVKQLGTSGNVSAATLYEKWTGVCLNGTCLDEMLKMGGFQDEVQWQHFLAIAAGHLTESLSGTMSLLCHLLTKDPVGGPPRIPCDTFTDLYAYLARLDCGPSDTDEEPAHLDDPSGQSVELESKGQELDENSIQTQDTGGQPDQETGNMAETSPSVGSKGNPHVPGIGPVIPEVQIQATIAYMQFWAAKQQGFVMPRNMDSYLCPTMEHGVGTRRLEEPAAQLAN